MEMMRPSSPLLVTISILIVAVTYSNAQLYRREIRSVSSGDSFSTILYPGESTLHEALSNLESGTSLLLTEGEYLTEQFVLVTGVSDVCITGQGNVVITCEPNVGLAFINVTNFVISNIKIEGCGSSGSYLEQSLSTLGLFIDLSLVIYPEMSIALFIGHCENLNINHVEVSNNIGFGLVSINAIGISTVNRLTAKNNVQPSDCSLGMSYLDAVEEPERYGGGAVFAYQDYLQPYQDVYQNQYFQLTIQEGIFMRNSECSFNYLSYNQFQESLYIRNLGYRLGGGGGLSLLLMQLNYHMQLITRDSYFQENQANVGSGTNLVILSGVTNTQIVFKNCSFVQNGASRQEDLGSFRIIGGAGLSILVSMGQPDNNEVTPPNVLNNFNTSVVIHSSQFTGNIAGFGGGLYFYSIPKSSVTSLSEAVDLIIIDCLFDGNIGYVGAAMQVWELKYHAAFAGIRLQLFDTNIVNNTIATNNVAGSRLVLQSTGVIDIRQMNMSMHGDCQIKDNLGTGLRAESSYVGIAGNITFSSNVGIRGGAMYLVTFSYVIVLPNASLYILNNIARETGAGIFSNFLGLNSYVEGGLSDCFLAFSYNNLGPCVNCSDLNSTGSFIKFEGNSALAGSQIFGNGFQNCNWAQDLLRSLNLSLQESVLDLVVVLFPNIFSFDTPVDQPEYFRTQPQSLSVLRPTTSSLYDNDTMSFLVRPGQQFGVVLEAKDSYNQNVSAVIASFVETSDPALFRSVASIIGFNNIALLQSNSTELPLSLYGSENENLTVTIYSTDVAGRAITQINVNLEPCGDGFVFNNATLSCLCDERVERLGVSCDVRNHTLVSPNNLWVGRIDGSDNLGVAECPLLYCVSGTNTLSLVNGRIDFNMQCNERLNRSGVICGECENGLSFVLGTSRCMKCSNISILLFVMFIVLGILLTLVVYYLDMTITVGLLNGAIFFSNLVTLYGEFLFPAGLGGANVIFIISWLSLNFGIEACLYDGMRGLDRLWWQLSFPIYLFTLMGLIVCLARTKCLNVIQKTNRLSAVRAFTTLMLLCYVSVLQVSAQLLGRVSITTVDSSVNRWLFDPSVEYFQGGHIPLLLMAAVLILLYIIPMPLLLLFPTLIFKSSLLNKYKPLYDSIWEPFEPKFRFWLGFRLIFRWVPFLLTFLASVPNNIFVTDLMLLLLLFLQLALKPFKRNWINMVDSLFLYLLVLMFTGTLYFVGLSNSVTDRSLDNGITIYNEILLALGFLIVCLIFFYHLVIRFPKLKEFVSRVWHKLMCKKGELSPKRQPASEQNVKMEDTSNRIDKETTSTTVTHSLVSFTDLREPLLDDVGVAGAV